MKSLTSDAELLNVQVSYALQDVENSLKNFATQEDYDAKMLGIFGDRLDGEKVRVLAATWAAGDFSTFPETEIRDSAEISGARGAFAQTTGKIYLSRELVNAGDVGAIGSVLLEEYGHYIDAQINPEDAPGDEGALFAAWVEGQPLNESDILTLKAEDDSAVVVLDGQEVSIEQDVQGRSPDGLSYLLSNESDTFTVTSGLLDSYFGGVLGLDGADYITGSAEVDIINGNQGNDTIDGAGGNDLLSGGQDNDLILGNLGDDGIAGNQGNDTLYGGEGNEYINGNQDEDIIFGDLGNDILRGGKGNDQIDGGDGNDTIIGDFGSDTLTGSSGSDVFVMRSDTAVTDLLTGDFVTDFNKFEDLIALSDDLTEAGLTLEGVSLTSGSSDTVLKVTSTGAILGVVKGVSPTDLQGRFINLEAKPALTDNNEPVVTFAAPQVTQTSADTYQMNLAGSDGSQYVAIIKNTGQLVYTESVKYTPSSSGNDPVPGYTLTVSPDASSATLQVDGSDTSWVLEKQGQNSVKLKQKTPQIEKDITEFTIDPSPNNTDSSNSNSLQNILCAAGKEFCDNSEKLNIADNLSLLASSLTLTGVGAYAGGVVGAFASGFKVIDFACLVLFGDDTDLAESVASTIPIPIPFKDRFSKYGGQIIDKIKITPKAKEILNNIVEFTADQFFGKVESSIQGKIQDLIISPVLNWLGNKGGVTEGGLMDNFRKALNIDFCNPQTSTPPTATPPTGEGTEVSVVFQGTALGVYAKRELYFNGKFVGTPPRVAIDNDFGKEVSIGKFPSGTELVFEVRVEPFKLEGGEVAPAGAPYSVFTNQPENAKFYNFGGQVPQVEIEDGWVPPQTSIVYGESATDFDDAVFQVSGARVEGDKIIVI
jgi:RTX calcium-binding nonapeptide repeat (4 copies)